jgi:hypothetical protein
MAIRAAPWHEEARLALAVHFTRVGEFEKAERAFLWARDATAKNREGEVSWFELYQQMLRLAEMKAQQ